MRAAWYERQGPAAEVLRVGELPAPEPGPGEVRVRLHFSGVNPGDTEKRSGWLGNPMASPLVVPHSDGAGVVDSVGTGVEAGRVGRRVWVWGAQSYRPSGTAAEYTVVPAGQAVDLPAGSATRSAPAWASRAPPRTVRCSGTARSPAPRCSCSAGSGRSPRSWPAGAGRR